MAGRLVLALLAGLLLTSVTALADSPVPPAPALPAPAPPALPVAVHGCVAAAVDTYNVPAAGIGALRDDGVALLTVRSAQGTELLLLVIDGEVPAAPGTALGLVMPAVAQASGKVVPDLALVTGPVLIAATDSARGSADHASAGTVLLLGGAGGEAVALQPWSMQRFDSLGLVPWGDRAGRWVDHPQGIVADLPSMPGWLLAPLSFPPPPTGPLDAGQAGFAAGVAEAQQGLSLSTDHARSGLLVLAQDAQQALPSQQDVLDRPSGTAGDAQERGLVMLGGALGDALGMGVTATQGKWATVAAVEAFPSHVPGCAQA
jgi:hypothetical protein